MCVSDKYEMRKDEGVSLLFLKSTKGAIRLSVPIRQTNRYQQYICLHIIWDLTQVYLEQKLVIEVLLHYPS